MYRAAFAPPPSAAAAWSLRLAGFGLLVSLLGVFLARSRTIDPATGLVIIGASWLFAAAGVLLALLAAASIWRTARPGAGTALAGLLLSLLLLSPAIYFAVQAVRLPVLNDISTDLADPPDFLRTSRAMAARNGQTPPAVDAAAREAQRRAYPYVQPVLLDMEVDEAFALVLKAVAARGWRVSDQGLPGGRIRIGHIDAVDRSLVLGFADDITIRLRPLAGQTRIDVRSASRFGAHDFGANAQRIAAFATELQGQLDAR